MAKLMRVKNQTAGDRAYMDARAAAYHEEQVAASEDGQRDRCPNCGRVSVYYYIESTPMGDVCIAECERCTYQGFGL